MRDWLKIVLTVVLTVLLVAVSFGAGFVTHATFASTGVVPSIAGLRLDTSRLAARPDQFKVYWEVWDIVKREFYGQVPDDKTMTYSAIRGALTTLNDPNTNFIDPKAASIERSDLAGQFEGIGATVQTNQQGQLVIVSPLPGQPAEKAGLKAGDIILKVDGRDISGLSTNDAVLLIRGPKGAPVTLTIQRDGAVPFDLTITRGAIETPSVIWRNLDDLKAPTTGYVRVSLFGERSTAELQRAVQELRSKGVKTVILDLRNNPGGYLNTAIDLTSQFIDDGVIAYERHNDGREQTFRARSGGAALDLPLVVLVNQGSASASEIVAGAVRDRKRGVIIGTKTFGKGSVQNVHQLSDGSTLHVTVAHWLTPQRHDISKAGIEPDEVVEQEGDAGTSGDRQLQRAIELLVAGR